MRITKIEAQVKAKGRYSVFVDNKFAFGISEEGLISSRLSQNDTLDKVQLDQLKDTARLDKLYNQALSLIMRRPRSSWEIRDYLRRKDVNDDQSQQIYQRLENKGYINDLDFAKRWVENRRLLKATSTRKLDAELRQKRVDQNIISQVLSNDETDEIEVILRVIEKKRQQPRYRDKTKLMQYLAQQGYRYADIKQALELAGDTG